MELHIHSVSPGIGVPGGEVIIQCEGFHSSPDAPAEILFGGEPGHLVSWSENRIIARIGDTSAGSDLVIHTEHGTTSPYPFLIGSRVAEELHPVCNPVIDCFGNILVTLSGSRGQKLPYSVYRISAGHEKEPYLADILNPSGLAIDRNGDLFVSSRHEGIVYRVDESRQITRFADNLGIATGLVFDAEGFLYVGDRSGSIFKIDPDGNSTIFTTLEPSVSAYHMVLGPDACLYVSGPTLSSQDVIYRIEPNGEIQIFFRGLGRPQGMAFDSQGRLYVGASYEGWKGIHRLNGAGQIERFVAGPVMVGMVFDALGNLYMVDTQSLYYLMIGNNIPC